LKTKIILLFSLLALGCGQTPEKINSDSLSAIDSAKKNKTTVENKNNDSVVFSHVHLADTTFVDGNHVTFLRPDDARYESYAKDPKSHISDVDADFGANISTAIDTIIQNKKFKGISAIISSRRYIVVKDCITCPIIIDRDTINYGVILSGKGKELKIDQQVMGAQYYIGMVKDYFKVRK
jgi:hypothetical protein